MSSSTIQGFRTRLQFFFKYFIADVRDAHSRSDICLVELCCIVHLSDSSSDVSDQHQKIGHLGFCIGTPLVVGVSFYRIYDHNVCIKKTFSPLNGVIIKHNLSHIPIGRRIGNC